MGDTIANCKHITCTFHIFFATGSGCDACTLKCSLIRLSLGAANLVTMYISMVVSYSALPLGRTDIRGRRLAWSVRTPPGAPRPILGIHPAPLPRTPCEQLSSVYHGALQKNLAHF